MFREALSIANQYTFPVVMSRRTVGGACSSSIGSFVIVNDEGWIVTAGHILRQYGGLNEDVAHVRSIRQKRTAIETDASIQRQERKRQLAALPKIRDDQTEHCSIWWGADGWKLKTFGFLNMISAEFGELADIGVGQLENFDPETVQSYPVFKDPGRDFEPGVSLCKQGFPFHSISPQWNDAKSCFVLPPEAVPLPRFPLEGIFTRITEIVPDGVDFKEFPILYVETSSPGLRGQSGGPTFDTKGTIWAIQAKTVHLPLGFDPPVPGGKRGQTEHQFLNVGLGVHPTTMFGVFDHHGIKYNVSAY